MTNEKYTVYIIIVKSFFRDAKWCFGASWGVKRNYASFYQADMRLEINTTNHSNIQVFSLIPTYGPFLNISRILFSYFIAKKQIHNTPKPNK